MTARSASVAALLLALASCKPSSGPVAPNGGTGGPGGSAVGTTPGGIVHGGPVVPVTKPVELLPAGTLALFEASSPARIAEILGREQLVHRFAQQYREISREIVEETGHDLLDPKELPAIGVDPDGKLGGALVAVDREAVAFWWTLRDPARFRSWVIDRIGRKEKLTSTPYAGAEVLRIDDDASLVIRAPFAVLVIDERELPMDKALAHTVATMEPGRSLAQSASFRKSTGALAKGDGWGFVDVQEIVRRAGAEMDAQKPSSNWAAEELAAARQRGEKPERLAEIERQAREVDEQNKRWREREQAQSQLFRTMFAGIEGAGMSVSDKKGGPVFEMQLVAEEGSMAKKLWKNLEHVPVVSQVASGTPGIMLSLSLDSATAFEMVEMFAKADGEPWPEVVGEVRKVTGLDLDKDIRPLLAGSGGAAVTIDGPPRFGDEDALKKQVDFVVHVEVTDPAKAKAALATAAKTVAAAPKRREKAEGGSSRKEPTVKRDAKTGGLRIDLPDFKPIVVAVAGRQLVVTSDPAVLGRIEAGKSGDAAKKADPKGAFAAFTRPGQAGAFYADAGLGALTLMGRKVSRSDSPILFEDPETAKIPKTREHRAKEKEIRLLDVRIDAAERRRAQAEEERIMKFVRPWGVTVIAGAEDKRGITLTGGQFLRGASLAKVVEEMLVGILEMSSPRPEDNEAFKLFDERSKRLDELRQIRERDLAKAREKKPR